MTEQVTLTDLNQNSVSVKKQNYTTEGQVLGLPWRRAYMNSEHGRAMAQQEIPEPHLSAVMIVWGNEPTVLTE